MNNKSVKEIHLKRAKMWDASIENHSRYINKNTGHFDSKYTEKRSCPVCSENNEKILFDKEGGSYVKCYQCQMVYLNPVFKDDYLEDYYRNNHSVQSEVVENDSDFYSKLYNQGLDSVENLFTENSSILDIGCSAGVFLDIAKNRGWSTFGIELNETEFLHCKNKGHTVYNADISEVDLAARFDVISLWDVFEHIKDGRRYLSDLKQYLNSKGVVFLQIPSADALAARILQQNCNMFDGLEHVNLYSLKAINKLADDCGFDLLSVTSVISEMGVIDNYLNYDSPYFGEGERLGVMSSLIDEKVILDDLLGYKLQIVLRPSK